MNGISEQLLDARRLICPMPVIKTQDAISQLQPGQRLRVVCTDPGVKFDIPAWVRVHGHRIVSSNIESVEHGDEIYFVIEVQAS